jgi:hypothetical protein
MVCVVDSNIWHCVHIHVCIYTYAWVCGFLYIDEVRWTLNTYSLNESYIRHLKDENTQTRVPNTYIHKNARVCIHTYTHTYIHTHVHTYIHTHIHTKMHARMHTYLRSACVHTPPGCRHQRGRGVHLWCKALLIQLFRYVCMYACMYVM